MLSYPMENTAPRLGLLPPEVSLPPLFWEKQLGWEHVAGRDGGGKDGGHCCEVGTWHRWCGEKSPLSAPSSLQLQDPPALL